MSGNSTFVCRDSSGGAAIQGFMGRTLELDEPGLFAIDFVDAPELEVIHIKRLDACRQPHLTFYNLPSLRQVILPERQPPAIVHFASFAAPDMIVIEGRVSELDAAWQGTQFSMQSASQQQPWTRVVIRSARPEHDPVPAGGLVIMSGDLPGTTDQLTLNAGSDWLLTDVSSLRHVQIDTHGQVSLQRLPRLTTVHSNIDGLTLHMENTPAVERVSGELTEVP